MPALIFDTCCGCINLKTGCLIIGYLQLVGEIILTILTIMALGASDVVLKNTDTEITKEESTLVLIIVGAIVAIILIIALAFTITLLVGVHKGKRGHVKAYLIYFCIFMVIFILGFFASLAHPVVSNIISNLVTIVINLYFALVIRSYFYKMNETKPAVYTTA